MCVRYGHVKKMADAEAEGIREAGVEVDMYQYVPLPSHLSDVFFHPHIPSHLVEADCPIGIVGALFGGVNWDRC